MIDAYGYIFKKENKQSVKEVVVKNLCLKTSKPPQTFTLKPRTSSKANPTRLWGFKILIKYDAEQNPKAAAIKAEDLGASWLKRLDDETFFDRVYGRK